MVAGHGRRGIGSVSITRSMGSASGFTTLLPFRIALRLPSTAGIFFEVNIRSKKGKRVKREDKIRHPPGPRKLRE
jgi:hypothetical protein